MNINNFSPQGTSLEAKQAFFLERNIGTVEDPLYEYDSYQEDDSNVDILAGSLKILKKKVFDGVAWLVIYSDNIKIYWQKEIDATPLLIAEAELVGQIWNIDQWVDRTFNFSSANLSKITTKTYFDEILQEDVTIDIPHFYRAFKIEDIPGLSIVDAVWGLELHWKAGEVKFSFYADAPGQLIRLQWQARVLDAAIAQSAVWSGIGRDRVEITPYKKGLSFSIADYPGESNHTSGVDAEAGWTWHRWAFEPDGFQVPIADVRTPSERFTESVGLLIDPYLKIDEQSSYIDVSCDGYLMSFPIDDTEENCLIVYDPTKTTEYFIDLLYLHDGSNPYYLGWDTNLIVEVIENTSSRVKIRLKGNYDQTSGASSNYLSNSTSVEIIFVIYPDRYIVDHKWILSGTVPIGWIDLTNITGTQANLTNEQNVYENSGSESNAADETRYPNADYIGFTATEMNVQLIKLFDSGWDNTLKQLCYYGGIVFTENDGTSSETIGIKHLKNLVVIDSEDRIGSSQIYDSTDRLAMGDQYKDLKLDTTLDGGSRIFDGVDQYLQNTDFGITTYPLTISFFLKPVDETPTTEESMWGLTDFDHSNGEGFRIGLQTSGAAFAGAVDDGAASEATSGNNATAGWNHLLGEFKSTTSRTIILNGSTPVENTTSRSPILADLDSLSIAAVAFVSSWYYHTDGQIAHVAIWDIELSANEKALLAEGADPRTIRPNALVAYYPLIDDDKDVIGGYDMTPYNSPTWSTTDFPNLYFPDKGRFVNDLNIPVNILESGSGFAADGAWHVEPVNPREKPDTDNDNLKTELSASGGIAEDLILALVINEGSGTTLTDQSGNSHDGTLDGTYTPDWAFDSDPMIGDHLDFENANDDFVSFVDHADFDLNVAEDYTWHFLIKPESFTEYQCLWGSMVDSSNYFFIYVHTSTDAWWGNVTGGVSAGWVNSGNVIAGHTDTDNILSTSQWAFVTVTYDSSESAASRFKIYINGIDDFDTADVEVSGTIVNLSIATTYLGNNSVWQTTEGYDGKVALAQMWNRVLNQDEIRFITNNPYYLFGEAGRVKLTMDRTRIRPAVVLDDMPFFSGNPINPVDHLLNHLKLDDNEASAILKAEVGPDATWRSISGPADRNTNTAGDSVQEIGRGRNLDTQNGTSYIEITVGAGTVHDNAFLKKGSILIKFKPEFVWSDSTNQFLFELNYDDQNRVLGYYGASGDNFNLWSEWGNVDVNISAPAHTENYSLQREHIILFSWDSDKDLFFIAIDGQMIATGVNTGTPTANDPTIFNIGCTDDRFQPADIIIDEIKTFNEAILPYGAYFTGNGAVDVDVAHDDITAFIKGDEADTDSLKIGTGVIDITNVVYGTDVRGNANSAFDFSSTGTDDVNIPFSNIPTVKGSISFWFKQTEDISGSNFFACSSDWQELNLFRNGTNNEIDFYISGIAVIVNASISDIWDGRWHFIQLTYDTDIDLHILSINGIIEIIQTDTIGTIAGSGVLYIGQESGSLLCGGYICDFYITDDPNTPEIWTAFGKSRHLPLINQ